MGILLINCVYATGSNDILESESIKARVMSERNLRPASVLVETEARKVLDECGITENVIILESGGEWAHTFRQEGQRFIVFPSQSTSAYSQAEKLFAIYHEVGHLHYDHATAIQESILMRAESLIAAILACYFLYKSFAHFKAGKSLLGFSYLIGIPLFSTLQSSMHAAHKIDHEREADLFACQKLVKNGRSDVVLSMIKNYEASEAIRMPNFLVKSILLLMGISNLTPIEEVELLKGCLKDSSE